MQTAALCWSMRGHSPSLVVICHADGVWRGASGTVIEPDKHGSKVFHNHIATLPGCHVRERVRVDECSNDVTRNILNALQTPRMRCNLTGCRRRRSEDCSQSSGQIRGHCRVLGLHPCNKAAVSVQLSTQGTSFVLTTFIAYV